MDSLNCYKFVNSKSTTGGGSLENFLVTIRKKYNLRL